MTKPLVLAVATVLMDEKKNILLAKRSPSKIFPDYWELPGGKIEQGESATEALVRELKEEIAIKVNKNDLVPLSFISHCYDKWNLLMPVFICTKWSGQVIPQENQEIAWVSKDMIDQYKVLSADNYVIKLIKNNFVIDC